MARMYIVKIKSSKGIENITLTASDEYEARKVGERSGKVIGVTKKTSFGPGRALSKNDRITMLKRLAMMTKSRVSVTNSMKIMSENFTGKISETAKIIEQKVMKGDDFIEAIESMPADFPASTVSLIKTGMHSGELHKALSDAAAFEEEMYQIGKTASSGMIMAIGEFILASVLILGTAYWVGPWVVESDFMKAGGDAVNVDWAFWIANFMAILILIICVGSFALFLIAYVFKPLIPDFSDNMTLKIPVFRDLVLSKTYYSVFYGLSLLISSGVRLKESMEISAENAPAGAIKSDLLSGVKAIEEGSPFARGMVNLEQTDRACLDASQDANEIADAFMEVASYHRANYSRRVGQVVPTLSIISNMFMAMAGFLIFAMTMLPNLQLTRGILQ